MTLPARATSLAASGHVEIAGPPGSIDYPGCETDGAGLVANPDGSTLTIGCHTPQGLILAKHSADGQVLWHALVFLQEQSESWLQPRLLVTDCGEIHVLAEVRFTLDNGVGRFGARLMRFSASGQLLAEYPLLPAEFSSAQVSNHDSAADCGVSAVAIATQVSGQRIVAAISVGSGGQLQWQQQQFIGSGSRPPAVARNAAGITMIAHTDMVGGPLGIAVRAIAVDGSPLWQQSYVGPQGSGSTFYFEGSDAPQGGILVAGREPGSIGVLLNYSATGELLWAHRFGDLFPSAISEHNGRAYLAGNELDQSSLTFLVAAFDANGLLWESRDATLNDYVVTRIATADDRITLSGRNDDPVNQHLFKSYTTAGAPLPDYAMQTGLLNGIDLHGSQRTLFADIRSVKRLESGNLLQFQAPMVAVTSETISNRFEDMHSLEDSVPFTPGTGVIASRIGIADAGRLLRTNPDGQLQALSLTGLRADGVFVGDANTIYGLHRAINVQPLEPDTDLNSAVITRHDQTGAILWQHNIEWPLLEGFLARTAAVLPNGGIVVGGTVRNGSGTVDSTVIRALSDTGVELWTLESAPVNDSIADLKVASNGRIIAAGYQLDGNGVPDQRWLLALNGDGSMAWEVRQAVDAQGSQEVAIRLYPDDSILLLSRQNDGSPQLARFDAEGNPLWSRTLTGIRVLKLSLCTDGVAIAAGIPVDFDQSRLVEAVDSLGQPLWARSFPINGSISEIAGLYCDSSGRTWFALERGNVDNRSRVIVLAADGGDLAEHSETWPDADTDFEAGGIIPFATDSVLIPGTLSRAGPDSVGAYRLELPMFRDDFEATQP